MWIDDTLETLKQHYRKYSLVLNDTEERNLILDAFTAIAGASVLLNEIKDRGYPVDNIDLIQDKLDWTFKQLFFEYRKSYPEILDMTDDEENRFFRITPTGEIKINRRVYNVPKRHSSVGFVPSLFLSAWILQRYPEWSEKTQKK